MTMIEPGLIEARRLRDEGMAAVEDASDDSYIQAIDRRIADLNKTGIFWSANDLRNWLPDVRPQLIGARVRAAAMRKEMDKVGRTPSTLPSTHGHEIAVWQGITS